MIEVSLYSVPVGSDIKFSMGKCIDRARLNKEALGVGTMEFVKGFLKTNVPNFETSLNNADIIGFINGDGVLTVKDLASINYWLLKSGFVVKIFNVTDDEENAEGISPETSEWNIVDNNFLQDGFPTAIKMVPTDAADVIEVLSKVVDQSGLFDSSKLGSTKNPLKETIERMKQIQEATGRIEPGLATKVYDILNQVGIELFLAVGE